MAKIIKRGVRRVREANLSHALSLIHQSGPISRAEICRATGLSATTVSLLVDSLLQSGIIHESGTGKSSGGRPPILVQFDYGHRYVLGLDMGATQLTVVLLDLAGEVIADSFHEFDAANDPAGTVATVAKLIDEMLQKASVPISDLLGLGIAVPAPLAGKMLDRPSPVVLPAWQGFDLVGSLRPYFPFTIRVENDANAGAIAEKWWGKSANSENLAYIKLGTGVGSGLILNGSIYRGDGGTAGEIGHIPIDLEGPLCRCGRRGCLEAFIGVPNLIARAQQLQRDSDWETPSNGFNTIREIIQAANDGDPQCRELVKWAGNYLGIGLTSLINLFNPGLIVLGGKLAEAGDLLVEPVLHSVHEHAMLKAVQEVEITFSALGDDAVAIGAATTVLEHAFRPANISQIISS